MCNGSSRPAVVVDSITLCAVAYIPGDGKRLGAATVPVIVYVPLDTDDVVHPALVGHRFDRHGRGNGNGPEYTVPTVSFGIVPSVM